MPIPVTKYRCKFKCGTNSVASKKKMEEHEKNRCFRNPENKTCETCINRIYESEYDDFTVWHGRGCKVYVLNLFLEEVQEDLMLTNNHIKPIWHCPNHNISEVTSFTEQFINEVRDKINRKKALKLSDEKELKLPF